MKKLTTILLMFFLAQFGFACSCVEFPFEKEWNRVEVVMEIKIIGVVEAPKEDMFRDRILIAEVLRVHKGEIKSEVIEIFTNVDGGANCNYHFIFGESYLFYGDKGVKDDYYRTTICHRTGTLSERKEDLIAIQNR